MRLISSKKIMITTVGIAALISATFLPSVENHLFPMQSAMAAQHAPKSNQGQPNAPQGGPREKAESDKLLVTVVDAIKQSQKPLITGYGEVEARWTTELTAEVSGQVDYVSDKMLVGSQFKKGDVLARINAVDYESELASAKADLASAKVIYLEQQLETQQAKDRWELSGLSGKPSALTLKTPQLAEALAALESAKAALTKAEKNLARTEIIAPFNGRVSSRSINPGGYLSAGTSVGEIFATGSVEISIALDEQQFALIGEEAQAVNRTVNLVDTTGTNSTWTAKIARFQHHIDNTERTRKLVLEVNSAQAADDLMPGTFVKASIPGKTFDNLIKLPASALSRDGYIWYVENGALQRFKANIAYRKDDYIVVRGQESQSQLQVVRYPQSAFIPGQAVKAELVASHWADSAEQQTVTTEPSPAEGDDA